MPCGCTGCSCWSAFLTMMGRILLELEPEPTFLKLLLFRHFGHSNKKCDKYNAYPQYSNSSEVLTHQNMNLANSPPVSHTQTIRPIKDYSGETGEAAESLWGHSEWADILKWSMWIYENTYKRNKNREPGRWLTWYSTCPMSTITFPDPWHPQKQNILAYICNPSRVGLELETARP